MIDPTTVIQDLHENFNDDLEKFIKAYPTRSYVDRSKSKFLHLMSLAADKTFNSYAYQHCVNKDFEKLTSIYATLGLAAHFFNNTELFVSDLIDNYKNNVIKYLNDASNRADMLRVELAENVEFNTYILTNSLIEFDELFEFYNKNDAFSNFVENIDIFKYAYNNRLLKAETIKEYDKKLGYRSVNEIISFLENPYIVKFMLETQIYTFNKLVESIANVSERGIENLLSNTSLIEDCIQDNHLKLKDAYRIPLHFKTIFDIDAFTRNEKLIELFLSQHMGPHYRTNFHILNEILNNAVIDYGLTYDETCPMLHWLSKTQHQQRDILDFLSILYKQNLTIFKKCLERKVECQFDFTAEQCSELSEILSASTTAQNNFHRIVENNLQDLYSFEELKNLLSKDLLKRKNKLNV